VIAIETVAPPSSGLSADQFRHALRAYLGSRLTRRGATTAVSLLGAGSDDFAEAKRFLEGLAADGWSVPTWPRGLGGVGLGPELAMIWREELAGFDVPDIYPFRIGLNMVGPTLLEHGTAEQQRRWLPPIATGQEIWCQLFSEPGAGSDLAGLATSARRVGDGWEITGQKVWSSRAHYSQWGLVLARTDPEAVKHAGITCFALAMEAPGVEIRPLRQMNGDAHFNEVFLDNVHIDDTHRIAEPGEGWAVARTTLAHEREAAGSGVTVTPAQLIELVRRQGLANDPVVRDRLTKTIIQLEVARLAGLRARSTSGAAGPLGSGSKLRVVGALKAAADLLGCVLGIELATAPSEWQTLVLTAPSLSIRGGTDQVQRDILAERVLGLPKGPDPYRGRPWSEIPRS
jgi:alkylation response protein AidB-like acyl-CoA dehydrogenase